MTGGPSAVTDDSCVGRTGVRCAEMTDDCNAERIGVWCAGMTAGAGSCAGVNSPCEGTAQRCCWCWGRPPQTLPTQL